MGLARRSRRVIAARNQGGTMTTVSSCLRSARGGRRRRCRRTRTPTTRRDRVQVGSGGQVQGQGAGPTITRLGPGREVPAERAAGTIRDLQHEQIRIHPSCRSWRANCRNGSGIDRAELALGDGRAGHADHGVASTKLNIATAARKRDRKREHESGTHSTISASQRGHGHGSRGWSVRPTSTPSTIDEARYR